MTQTEWGIRYLEEMSVTNDGPHLITAPMYSERSARMALEHRVSYGRKPKATLVRREVTEWEEA